MDYNMLYVMDPIAAYCLASTTVVLFAAKDFVMLGMWTVSEKLLALACPKTAKAMAAKISPNPDEKTKGRNGPKLSLRDRRLIACREVSNLIFSVLMACVTVYFLLTTNVLATFSPCDPQAIFLLCSLLSLQLGKALFKAFYSCFVQFSIVQLIHWTILSMCFAAFLSPGTSPIIGVVGLVCDAADVQRHLCNILDAWGEPYYSRKRVYIHAVAVATTAIFRCCLPIGLLSVVVYHSSQGPMSQGGLALFFFYLTYMAAVNIFFMVYIVGGLRESIRNYQMYKATKLDSIKTLQFVLEMKMADVRYCKRKSRYFDKEYQEPAPGPEASEDQSAAPVIAGVTTVV